MASKYYKRMNKDNNAVLKLNKKRVFLIVIAVIFLVAAIGIKINKEVNESIAEKNREYGNIQNPNIQVQETDERGNTIITKEKISIMVINVGEGQSIFIDTPKADVLIDGGDKEHVSKVIEAIEPYADSEIEYLINTNPDARFSGGLPYILEKYKVKNAIYTKATTKPLIDALSKEDDCKKIKCESENISLGDGVMLSVYDKSKEENNLICVVNYNNNDILLTTSMASEEEELKIAPEIRQVYIYVASNFNNSSSPSARFLEIVHPRHSVISSKSDSESDYVERLKKGSSAVCSTFKNGNIICEVEGDMRKINVDTKNLL